MIPNTWKEHRRADDNELIGYVDEEFQARTVFGFPIGKPDDETEAKRALESLGLSYLAERWLLALPNREEPITVHIVEVSPLNVTVKSVDYGYEGDYGTPFTLDVPVSPSELRPERTIG